MRPAHFHEILKETRVKVNFLIWLPTLCVWLLCLWRLWTTHLAGMGSALVVVTNGQVLPTRVKVRSFGVLFARPRYKMCGLPAAHRMRFIRPRSSPLIDPESRQIAMDAYVVQNSRRFVISFFRVRQHHHGQVVENEPLFILIEVLIVVHDDEPDVVRGESSHANRYILSDGIESRMTGLNIYV